MQREREEVAYFDRERFSAFLDNLIFEGVATSEILNVIDDEMIEKLNRMEWKPDTVQAIPGISSAVAFYGEHYTTPETIRQNALNRLNGQYPDEEIELIQPDKGFPEIYQIPLGFTEPQRMLLQQFVAQEILQNSYEGLGVTAEDVDLFIITCSIPIQEDWAERISRMMGIPIEKMIIYHKACNSTGSAIFDVHNHEYDDELRERVEGFDLGERAVISTIAIEDANSITGKSDKMSPLLFATAVGATTFEYSPLPNRGPLTLVTGIQKDIEEGAQHLRYQKTYDEKNWPQYREKYRVIESKFLQSPPEGWLVDMNGPESGVYFRVNGIELTKEVLTEFAKVLSAADENFDFRIEEGDKKGEFDLTKYVQFIKKAIVHHPSHVVFDNLGKRLTQPNFGIGFKTEQVPFVIPEGNAPSVIIHIALARQLNDGEFGEGIKDGDKFMILSFGAGGSFTCAIYEYTDVSKLPAAA